MNVPVGTDAEKTGGTGIAVSLVSVADALPRYTELFALLSPDEQARSARYLHANTREEFVIGRACLRLLLGRALRTPPREIAFRLGEHGKPEVDGLQFNLSHSHGLIAVALSFSGAVGIDIEKIDRKVEVLDVAAATFSNEELQRLQAVALEHERREAFFQMWTDYEARSKCLGVGILRLEETRQTYLWSRPLLLPLGYHGAVCSPAPIDTEPPYRLDAEAIASLLLCR